MTLPLVAVAHGSRDPAAALATHAMADAVRRARPGLEVQPAFLDHASPRLGDVVAALPGGCVVVPLLLAAAYHSDVDIPAVLDAVEHPAVQADVLGPDPLLLRALERRLAEAGVAAGDPATALVLAAAGSSSDSAADGVRATAQNWATRGWWAVEPVFASAARPTVAEAVAALRRRGAPRIAVATYLLFPGLFADRLTASGADVVAAPLAAAPEVVALVLRRFDQATALAGLPRAGR